MNEYGLYLHGAPLAQCRIRGPVRQRASDGSSFGVWPAHLFPSTTVSGPTEFGLSTPTAAHFTEQALCP